MTVFVRFLGTFAQSTGQCHPSFQVGSLVMHSKLSFSSSQFQYYSTSRELRIAWATATGIHGTMDGWQNVYGHHRDQRSRGQSHFARREKENYSEITAQCPKLVTTQKCAQSVCSCLTIQTFGWLSLNNECVRKTQRNLPCRIRTMLAVLPFQRSYSATQFWGRKTLKNFFCFWGTTAN